MIRLVFLGLLLAATAQAEMYRWKDGRGTVHYTNSEYEIPTRYRNRVEIVNLGLPVAAPATAQPPSPPSSPLVSTPAVLPTQPVRAAMQPSTVVAPPGSPKSERRQADRQRQRRERSSHSDE